MYNLFTNDKKVFDINLCLNLTRRNQKRTRIYSNFVPNVYTPQPDLAENHCSVDRVAACLQFMETKQYLTR